jgi:uncharacterized membrane protein
MTGDSANLVAFLGRFHPVLVHLPIGGLIVLGGLELIASRSRHDSDTRNHQLIAGFVAASAILSALCGLMLARSGGYDAQLLKWHKWAGIVVASGCTLTFLLSGKPRPKSYYFSLIATFGILGIAAHLGGSITHGRDYLTHYAPALVRSWMEPTPNALRGVGSSGTARVDDGVFTDFVQPILRDHCVGCHGSSKQKGELRLDSLEGLLKGGESGPVLARGRSVDSELIRRMREPLDAEHHMPPAAKPQPTQAQIRLIELWIDAGVRTNSNQPSGRSAF